MTYTVHYVRDGRREIHGGLTFVQAKALRQYVWDTFRILANIEMNRSQFRKEK